MPSVQWKMNTRLGPIYLTASEHGLQSSFWKAGSAPFTDSLDDQSPAVRILSKAAAQIEEYLEGQRRSFDLPLDVRATEFQKKVWAALQTIPFGQTVSYSDIAKRTGDPKSVRAVGSANGKNPVCIVVPCHRVIAASGALSGYSGGIGIKEELLKLERRLLS